MRSAPGVLKTLLTQVHKQVKVRHGEESEYKTEQEVLEFCYSGGKTHEKHGGKICWKHLMCVFIQQSCFEFRMEFSFRGKKEKKSY